MKDVFGKTLYAYWKGDHRTPHFIRRDDGYLDEIPTGEYFKTSPSTVEKDLLKHATGKILDVGCGAGRALHFLKKQKLKAYGIDFSPLAIQICKERGFDCELKSIFTMRKPTSFNTLLLFGNNIGIGGDLKGVEKLLKKLFSLTKKGGRLLVTSLDVTKTNNPSHLTYHQKNLKNKRYVGEVKIRVEYKKMAEPYFKWVHVDAGTLGKLARKAGWNLVHVKNKRDGAYGMVLER